MQSLGNPHLITQIHEFKKTSKMSDQREALHAEIMTSEILQFIF